MDEGEEEGSRHPALDPHLNGRDGEPVEVEPNQVLIDDEVSGNGSGRNMQGGKRDFRKYRGPVEYGELLKALGANLTQHEATIRYYRERAVPYLIPFPKQLIQEATDPLPEGLETWDFGMPLEDVDWMQSVLTSPHVVPGVTTVQRVYGETPGGMPEERPVDLYLGVDCSGSMFNPQLNVSFVVLAGAIMALSALRVGARVKVVLSGEPGESVATEDFTRNEHEILEVLTGYLGTGYSFGINRLSETFEQRKESDRKVHILIVSDADIFSMLENTHHQVQGWEIARRAAEKAGGGATYVLNMPPNWMTAEMERMKADHWDVYLVQDWEQLVAYARAFSQAKWGEKHRATRRPTS